VQVNYAELCSLGGNAVRLDQAPQPPYSTSFLDVVSSSPISVIEDFILRNADVVHQKGKADAVHFIIVACIL